MAWSRPDPGTVVMLSKSGGAEDIVATEQPRVGFVLLDDDSVYWTVLEPYLKLMRAER